MDLANDDVRVLFKKYFYPAFASLLVTSLYIVVDGFFISYVLGEKGLAAANIVVPLFPFLVGIRLFFGLGGASIFASLVAEEKIQQANAVFSFSIYVNFVLAAFLTLGLFVFSDDFSYLLGANSDIIEYSNIYLKTFSFSILFFSGSIALGFFIRIDKSPKLVMLASIVGAAVNVVLDFVFMIVFDLGMFGASLATVLSNILGFGILIHYVFQHANTLGFVFPTIDKKTLKNFIFIGLSGFLVEFCLALSIFSHNKIIEQTLGTNGLSAYAVVNYIYPLLMPFFLSLSESIMPIVSFNYFIQIKRAQEVLFYALKLSLILGFVGFLFVYFGANYLVQIFLSPSDQSFYLAIKALRLFSFSILIMGANLTIISYLQAAHKGNLASLIVVFNGLIFILIFLFTLPIFWGADGIWITNFAAEVLTILMITIYFALFI